jgi:hypothetical protein
MRKIVWLALVAFALVASPAHAQDAIDLHRLHIHSSPTDVADWPVTVTINAIHVRPRGPLDGFTFDAAIPDSWEYHVPGWGVGTSCPGDGCLWYTVWPVFNINGELHTAGIVQMFRGRENTGAPWLTDWHEWAYARDRWGELVDHQPAAGELVGLFLTAGNARDQRTVTSKRERSNLIAFPYPAGDSGEFRFDAPAPQPPPSTDPPSPPGGYSPPPSQPMPPDALALLQAQVKAIADRLAAMDTKLDTLATKDDLAALRGDLVTLVKQLPLLFKR